MPYLHSWMKECQGKINMALGNDIDIYKSYLFANS